MTLSLPSEIEAAAELHRQTRSLRSVILLLVAAAGVIFIPAVPAVSDLLGVTLADTALAMGTFAAVSLAAALTYHRWGLSRPYLAINDLETLTTAGACLYLVYASGAAVSIFWLFYFLLGFHVATAAHLWSRPWELGIFVVAPAGLAVGFWLRDGSSADVAITLVLGGSGLWIIWLLSKTSRELRRSLSEQARLEARLRALLLKEERQRISRNLHDGVGAELSSVVWQLRGLREAASDPELQARLDDVLGRVHAGLEDLRSIVWETRADSRSLAALAREIESRCRAICRDARLRFGLVASDPERLVAGPLCVAIVRVALEATHNAERHGEASEITLRLEAGDALQLTVDDDGRGIAEVEAMHEEGGLANMRRRALDLGGSLTVEPRDGGTRIVLRVPWS